MQSSAHSIHGRSSTSGNHELSVEGELTIGILITHFMSVHNNNNYCYTGDSAVVFSQPPVMAELMSQVARKTPTKWFEVGIQLNIDTSILNAFDQHTRDNQRLYSKVFDQWKKEQKLPYTWDTIIIALETIGEKETVSVLRKWMEKKASNNPSHATTSGSEALAAGKKT